LSIILISLPLLSQAGTYPTSIFDNTAQKAGYCTMVTLISEKSETSVYTLNPTHTVSLANSYFEYWSRWPRCDELQFHIDHNTSLSRLRAWLSQVERQRLQNVNQLPYAGQTVSTMEHEWFLIINYTDGIFYEEINDAWKNLNFTQPALPTRLQSELNLQFINDSFNFKDPCRIGTYSRGVYCRLMDFSWTAQNFQTYGY